jgi:hypothetical protein
MYSDVFVCVRARVCVCVCVCVYRCICTLLRLSVLGSKKWLKIAAFRKRVYEDRESKDILANLRNKNGTKDRKNRVPKLINGKEKDPQDEADDAAEAAVLSKDKGNNYETNRHKTADQLADEEMMNNNRSSKSRKQSNAHAGHAHGRGGAHAAPQHQTPGQHGAPHPIQLHAANPDEESDTHHRPLSAKYIAFFDNQGQTSSHPHGNANNSHSNTHHTPSHGGHGHGGSNAHSSVGHSAAHTPVNGSSKGHTEHSGTDTKHSSPSHGRTPQHNNKVHNTNSNAMTDHSAGGESATNPNSRRGSREHIDAATAAIVANNLHNNLMGINNNHHINNPNNSNANSHGKHKKHHHARDDPAADLDDLDDGANEELNRHVTPTHKSKHGRHTYQSQQVTSVQPE